MTDEPQAVRLATRRAYTGRLLRVDVDTVKNPAGKTVELEMIRHPGAAAVVAFLSDLDGPDPQLLLIRQYRYAADNFIWEIPAGVLEPGEEPEACARRELLEETGAEAQHLHHLTTVYTTPGFADEQIHLFLASGLTISQTAHEPDELIEVASRPLSAALEMIRDGEIADGKTIAAILYVAGFTLKR